MAGSDQSVNLGGMLSQIAETTGSMGDAYKPVMQAATKPQGDMNDPAHLQRLAQWASSNGDAQAASMYMQQARQASAEKKEAEQKAELERRNAAANAATAQFKQALESGNAEDIARAEEALLANANANGYNALERMNAASSAVKRQKDAEFAESERQRVAKERAEMEKFSAKLNAVTNPEEIQAVVEAADPSLADQAQRMATNRLAYLSQMEARQEKMQEDQAAVPTDFTAPEGLPDKLSTQFKAEHERILELEKNSKNADGTWKTSMARSAVDKAMRKLIDDANRASVGLIVAEESDRRQRLRSIDHKRANVATSIPTNAQYDRIKDTLEAEYLEAGEGTRFMGFEPNRKATDAEVIARFRQDQMAALDAEVAAINGPSPEAGEEYTEAQTATIEEAVAMYPNKSREEVIAALKAKGKI